MEYLLISFIAGILTILAPCVFTLLPIILGGSLLEQNWKKPAIIISSLAISIFIFTIILRASTLLIDIHPSTWNYISASIIITFGVFTLFPNLWGEINVAMNLSSASDQLLHKSGKYKGVVGDIFLGAALGPVFSSCSPTYAIIVATLLPQSITVGIINLIMYILGLVLVLVIITLTGQSVITHLKWASNPNGIFKKSLGIIFILVGLAIFTGLDKRFETYLLDQGILDATTFELQLLKNK